MLILVGLGSNIKWLAFMGVTHAGCRVIDRAFAISWPEYIAAPGGLDTQLIPIDMQYMVLRELKHLIGGRRVVCHSGSRPTCCRILGLQQCTSCNYEELTRSNEARWWPRDNVSKWWNEVDRGRSVSARNQNATRHPTHSQAATQLKYLNFRSVPIRTQ